MTDLRSTPPVGADEQTAAVKMMEETSVLSDGGSYDSLEEDDSDGRPAERWAPLGAANVSPPPSTFEDSL